MKILLTLVALVAALFLYMLVVNLRTPPGLGVSQGKLAPLPGTPNAVSSQSEQAEFRVAPFPFMDTTEDTKAALKSVLKTYGGIRIVEENDNYLHAIHITPRMRFRDDLEFYLDESTRQAHFRSASRIGRDDLGLNRARHEQLMRLYRTR